MIGIRKLFGFLMVLSFAAFALPAAAQKVYTLKFSPPSLTAGSSLASLSATMNNISTDTGNSTVKSFKLVAPNGITVVTPASGNLVPLGGGYTATIQNNGGSIDVSNIQLPLKPFGTALVLNMKVNVACTATGGAWTVPGVWNGSGFTGQTFLFTDTLANPSQVNTGIDPGCVNFTFTTSPNPSFVTSPLGTVNAVFTNTSASVNLNSAQVTAPPGLTITGGTASNGGTVLPINGGLGVMVNGLTTSVAPGGSLTLSLNVTTAPSCTGAGAAFWSNALASSGNSPTGSTQLVFQGIYPKTSVDAVGCSLSFVNPPAGVAQFPATFSLTVHVTGGTGSPSVTIAALPTGVTGEFCPQLSTTTTLTQNAAVGSDTTFSGLSFNGTGTCKVTANASNYNNSNATLTSFKVLDGTLASCGGTKSSNPTTSPPLDPLAGNAIPPTDGQTGWALVRGKNADDGSCGPLIPFTASFDPTTREAIFTEISLGQHPSVEYIILWGKVSIGADPFAAKQPCVSWGVDNPAFPATPDAYGCGGDYVPGLACMTDDVDGGSAVMPIIPNVPPFDAASNPQSQYLADVANNKKAKACIAQHGFTSGTGTASGSAVYWTKVIDQSDIGVRLP